MGLRDDDLGRVGEVEAVVHDGVEVVDFGLLVFGFVVEELFLGRGLQLFVLDLDVGSENGGLEEVGVEVGALGLLHLVFLGHEELVEVGLDIAGDELG